MTLPSLDIGVGRAGTFVVLVRVTPLGPVFAAVDRSLEALVNFVVGSLDGSGTCSFALPLSFSPGSVVSGTGGGSGAGVTTSVVAGVIVEGIDSGALCFSDGCRSIISGATSGTGPGSGAGSFEALGFEALEVEGSSGYGSAGIGGSTETDLDLETRWEGGVGDLEGNGKGSGLGCGGIRWGGRLVRPSLGSGFDCDWDAGGGFGKGAGGSRFIGSVVASLLLLGRREEADGND